MKKNVLLLLFLSLFVFSCSDDEFDKWGYDQAKVGDFIYSDDTFSSEFAGDADAILISKDYKGGQYVMVLKHVHKRWGEEALVPNIFTSMDKEEATNDNTNSDENSKKLLNYVRENDLEGKYPAFEYVDEIDSWRMLGASWVPNAKYMKEVIVPALPAINAALAKANRTPLKGYLWTSTQESDISAWAYDVDNGEFVALEKSTSALVVPIAHF